MPQRRKKKKREIFIGTSSPCMPPESDRPGRDYLRKADFQ